MFGCSWKKKLSDLAVQKKTDLAAYKKKNPSRVLALINKASYSSLRPHILVA
jgi:hypothetical protein